MAASEYKVHQVGLARPPNNVLRYDLSDTDLTVAKIHMKVDLFYPLPGANVDTAAVVKTLHTGLARALAQIPTFASTISKDDPASRTYLRVEPDSTVQLGERHLAEPSFASLAAEHFSLAALDHNLLLPPDLQKHAYTLGDKRPNENGIPALFTQANFIPGGLILAVAFNHTQADAWTMHRFFTLWARHAKLAHTGAHEYVELGFGVDFDRAPYQAPGRLQANDPDKEKKWLEWGMPTLAGKSEEEIMALVQAAVKPTDIVGMLLHIPHDKAAALKQRASPAPPAYVSTYDSVCALLWRALLRARIATGRFSADQDTMLRQPCNVRGRSADAKLSYIGNAPGPAASGAVPAAEVLGSDGLRFAAEASRRGILKANVDDIRVYEDFVFAMDPQRLGLLRLALTCSTMTATSWQQMAAFQEYDFGFGFPAAFRSPGAPLDGGVVVFPSPPGEGVTLWIGGHPENVAAMQSDAELLDFAVVKSVSNFSFS